MNSQLPIFPRSAPSPFMGLGKHNFLSLCLIWTFHIDGITQYVAFCAWILLLSIVFSRFIHVAAHRSTVFPIMLHVYGFTTFCLRNLIIIYYLFNKYLPRVYNVPGSAVDFWKSSVNGKEDPSL